MDAQPASGRPPVRRLPCGDGPPDGALGSVGLVAKLRAVLRVRDFRRLWLSMSLSSFGDWLGLLAITATATSLVNGFAAANFALGGVLLFRLLPAIVLGPLAGAFADRFDRRKTMVVVDVIRFGLFASIPIVDNLIWLFVAQFLIEAFTLFWIPAKEAAVPNMLRKDQLEPANQLSLVTTYGLTPVLASIVFAVLTTRRRPAVGRHPRRRPGRPRAVPERADVPGRRGRHLEPAVDQRPSRGRPGGRRRRPSSAR